MKQNGPYDVVLISGAHVFDRVVQDAANVFQHALPPAEDGKTTTQLIFPDYGNDEHRCVKDEGEQKERETCNGENESRVPPT